MNKPIRVIAGIYVLVSTIAVYICTIWFTPYLDFVFTGPAVLIGFWLLYGDYLYLKRKSAAIYVYPIAASLHLVFTAAFLQDNMMFIEMIVKDEFGIGPMHPLNYGQIQRAVIRIWYASVLPTVFFPTIHLFVENRRRKVKGKQRVR